MKYKKLKRSLLGDVELTGGLYYKLQTINSSGQFVNSVLIRISQNENKNNLTLKANYFNYADKKINHAIWYTDFHYVSNVISLNHFRVNHTFSKSANVE